MPKIKYISFFILFTVTSVLLAQLPFGNNNLNQPEPKHVRWSVSLSKENPEIGETVEIIIKGDIDETWHVYGSEINPDLPLTPTTIDLKSNESYKLVGKLKAIKPKVYYDSIFEGEASKFEKKALFNQKITFLKPVNTLQFIIAGQVCTDVSGKCIQFEEDVVLKNINVLPAKEKAITETAIIPEVKDTTSVTKNDPLINIVDTVVKDNDSALSLIPENTNTNKPSSSSKDNSLWLYLLFAMGSGVVALLTPCVFPMVPMTVTLFTKTSKSRSEAIKKALVYGFSIITIYTILGIVPSIFFGEDFNYVLTSHWLTNLIFFVVFIIFGASFLGMFELTLPSSFVNKVDAQADKSGGYTGIFFMAFTLVLVSFSCTAPFVGTILIEASQGNAMAMKPVLGMLVYSATFALPFMLFAMFPSFLQSLPKSGGWLNTVKVVFGFIELGLALKFLSAIDLIYHWGILDRDIFIALWMALSILLTLYLLGKIKLPHDSAIDYISVGRLGFSIIPLVFTLYLLPGLFGAPLNALSGILPPMDNHDFDLPKMIRDNSGSKTNNNQSVSLPEKPRFGEFLKLPHSIEGYFDYEQAVRVAKQLNKPLFIDFTGHGCANCRRMEANVWAKPQILNMLKNDYLVVALYCDDPTELPKEEWVTDENGKVKSTIGKKNLYLQKSKFNNIAQPFYVLLDPYAQQPLVMDIKGSEFDVDAFENYLKEGLENFKQVKK